jgi:endonuclease/exonuclease/phosphatase family metal-dependent hydrolase
MKKKYLILSLILSIQLSYSQSKDVTLNVMSFNIYHGATMNNDFNLDVFGNIINAYQADLVAMQEVDNKAKRSKNLDLCSEIGIRTKLNPLFVKSINFGGGEYGNGILSKYSFSSFNRYDLPNAKGSEPRSLGVLKVKLETGELIAFLATHFDHKNAELSLKQSIFVNMVLSELNCPAILVGDLNAKPDSKTIKELTKQWTQTHDDNNFTYPSEKPNIKIDYIMYYPKSRWKVLQTEVNESKLASDHRAIFSKIKLLSK